MKVRLILRFIICAEGFKLILRMVDFEQNYMRQKGTKVADVEYDPNNAEKFKDENMYKYHENTQEYDPQTQPFSYFYVTLTGQIDFGEFVELDGLAIRYNFVAGNDWNLAGGSKTGAGQHSFKGVSVKGST